MKKFNNQSFWAITSYFNPCNYQRRLDNYKIFRQFLNIPLVTVELSFNGNFQLTKEDADILVQIKGNEHNIMWQKERLLNIALTYLPDECENVVWLDCDIVFEDENWYLKASELLEKYHVIQLFKKAYHLPKNIGLDNFNYHNRNNDNYLFIENSLLFNLLHHKNVAKILEERGKSPLVIAPGVAWAGKRKLFQKYKFYDRAIIGGGDAILAHSSYGAFNTVTMDHLMNKLQINHYLEWANLCFKTINHQINYLDSNLFHLWHGEVHNRYYYERYQKLQLFNFNPYNDIILDDNKCWKWNSNKPELHQYVKDYFYSRKEDG